MAAFDRRSFAGAGAATVLSAGINASVTAFSVLASTNWPDGSGGDFFVVVDRGTASEEKVRCQSRSGLNVTVRAGGRGADGTAASTHAIAATVELCLTAFDLDEANAHVSNQQANPHPVYVPRAGTDHAIVEAAEARTSSSYGDLTTPGPAVTLIITGTRVLVTVASYINAIGSGEIGRVSVAVSGASTVAASDTTALIIGGATATEGRCSVTSLITGLTPGSNTFTLKYAIEGTSVAFRYRELIVQEV